MTKPHYWDDAIQALAERDRVLAKLIAEYPGSTLTRRGDPFTTLARAIVGQQISVKAAQTIWEPAAESRVRRWRARAARSASASSRKRVATLRACGLSLNKAEYIRDLARHFASARLDPRAWPALDDEALIEALVDVKGIGRWTAEMFLMFHETARRRRCRWPTSACRRRLRVHYFDGRRPTLAELRAIAEGWQPYRSVATWYLWRSLDPIPVARCSLRARSRAPLLGSSALPHASKARRARPGPLRQRVARLRDRTPDERAAAPGPVARPIAGPGARARLSRVSLTPKFETRYVS